MVSLYLLLVTLASTFPFNTLSQHQQQLAKDSTSLLSFKDSIFSDPSNLLSNWVPNTDCCTWFGITCDPFSSRVISLNFTSLKVSSPLAGTIPDSIGELSQLRALVISHQSFSGAIPVGIGKLEFLEILELQGNNFSGEIPSQITNLGSLQVLNLSSNLLTGEIPGGLIGLGGLRVVDLSNNLISGEIKVGNLSKCLNLTHLKLSNNLLRKNIPREIRKCKNLRTLLLDGNILEGEIPAEIGHLTELRVLDVSTNSLTEKIPKELGFCTKLSVLVLTNSSNFVGNKDNVSDDFRLEFNAFDGGVPYEILTLPSLQILWAPRANLDGKLLKNWRVFCSLRVLNLGQNSLDGVIPEGLGNCKNLTFLDLSSNYLEGDLPMQLQVPCMNYFNVSGNNISGILPSFQNGSCGTTMISYGGDFDYLSAVDVQIAYSSIPVWGPQMITSFGSIDNEVIIHDFSWNRFVGLVPLFSLGDELLSAKKKASYILLLNSNMFNGSLSGQIVRNCNDLLSFSVNLSANHISGDIHQLLPLDCGQIREFEAAYNQIGGSLLPDVGNLGVLHKLDLTGNRLSGSVPSQLGKLKFLNSIFLGRNLLVGEIPPELGNLTSLTVLDLSHNTITGSLPASLANAINLEIVLLNNNRLSGIIPSSFATLPNLNVFDVSFNNLSGPIPRLQHLTDCSWFSGNKYLDPCVHSVLESPPDAPLAPGSRNWHRNRKSLIIALATSASAVLLVSLAVLLVTISRKRKLCGLSSSLGKVVVTFADARAELSYDNVVRATGNFSIKNLIGTGGFGSTYRAELVPGYLVAVKRLSIGRFQGIQQFDAEIRTLGRIRHRNLVTLIGYYMGENEMFLIYNYLSGGNLETFIHDRSDKNVQWSVIYKIAFDIAQALAYLHYSCVPRILHRDIKPSNILLDEELNAYISDFGLARLLEVSQTHATTDVAGTFGYAAPEYATTCRVSDKSDVYSFGVVLLELMSGKKSLDPSFSDYGNGFNIVAWAKLLIKEGRFTELFLLELWEAGPKDNLLEILKLASTCTVESLSERPSMKQVLERLKQLKS